MIKSFYSFYIFIFFILISSCDKTTVKDDNEVGLMDSYVSTYAVIQGEIFDESCITCHNSNGTYVSGNLDLTSGSSYEALINEVPDNQAAYADGLLRVSTVSEDESTAHEGLSQSFLIEKIDAPNIDHLTDDHPGYGSIMPPDYLTNGEINYIKAWVQAGAPEIGHVADITLLENLDKYDPSFVQLDIPENGIQLHLGPFDVLPNQETEFFYYTSLGNTEEEYVNRVEISMKAGSHHFILYTYTDDAPIIPENVERYLRDENGIYQIATLEAMAYQIFFGGTQWSNMDISFPPNVGLRLPADTYIDQNTHYINTSNEIYTGEVYTNLHFTETAPEYIAEILQLVVIESLVLPPHEITTIEETFMFDEILAVYDLDPEIINSINIFQLFSHAHEKMTEFIVYKVDDSGSNEQVYWTDSWEHPPINCYGNDMSGCVNNYPTLSISENEGLKLRATYNNNTNEELGFGFLSTDEMMIVFGYFYTD